MSQLPANIEKRFNPRMGGKLGRYRAWDAVGNLYMVRRDSDGLWAAVGNDVIRAKTLAELGARLADHRKEGQTSCQS